MVCQVEAAHLPDEGPPQKRSWSHFMGIYRQKSSKSPKIDFRLRFEGPGVASTRDAKRCSHPAVLFTPAKAVPRAATSRDTWCRESVKSDACNVQILRGGAVEVTACGLVRSLGEREGERERKVRCRARPRRGIPSKGARYHATCSPAVREGGGGGDGER